MSSKPDSFRLRSSLAVRIGLWHAALFGVAVAVVLAAV